jgi:hypothetical protein
MYLGGGYKFGNLDYYGKGRYSPSLGKQTTGRERIIHTVNVDDIEEYDEEEDEIDQFVNDLNDEVGSQIKSKITNGLPMTITDPYAPRSTDRAAGQLKNTGGSNIFEFAGYHRNPIRKGISPYRQPKHSGPPLGTGGSGQAFRTTGNFIGIGTQYGSSRPHKLLTSIEDNNIFNLSDIDAPMFRAFKRQQNKIKKVLSIIKEYLL